MKRTYHVTYSEYYLIYEPDEGGGYCYSGKQIVEERVFSTFAKAKRFIRKWFNDCKDDENFWTSNNHLIFGQSYEYIGEGYIVELTREPVKEEGYKPYC